MHFVFEVDGYNALDHHTPVAWKLLQKHYSVTFIVVDNSNFADNVRIRFLADFPKFSLYYLTKITSTRQRFLFRQLSRLLFGRVAFLFRTNTSRLWWLRNVSRMVGIGKLSDIPLADIAISGWGDPSSFVMTSLANCGAEIVALPHGYPCIKNTDFNPHIKAVIQKTGKNPDFSLRNHFRAYVVATERNKRLLLDWKMDDDIVRVWGNARFSPEWIHKLHQILPIFQGLTDMNTSSLQRVVFFLPSSTSAFESSAIQSLISRLSDEDVTLVIKPHTREGQVLSKLLPKNYHQTKNVFVASQYDSSALIQWSTTVLNFATGTAVEALVLGKRFVFCKYLTTNSLSWEDCQGIVIANAEEEVLTAIRNPNWSTDLELVSHYLDQELLAGGRVPDPLHHYVEQLEFIARESKQ